MFVTLVAVALAHPQVGEAAGWPSLILFILFLNGAVLLLLFVETLLVPYRWWKGGAVGHRPAAPPLLGPGLLISFIVLHAGYDTAFYRLFPKLMGFLAWGVPF